MNPHSPRWRAFSSFRLPPSALLSQLRSHLKSGGVIAYPTESCYGLGCDPRNARAVRLLLRLKRRPQHKGLILIGADFSQLQRFVAPLSAEQRQRLAATWPGPHTWLLPTSARTPRWLRGRHETLAVRVTAHPEAAGLCRALRMALVSTSANLGGRKPAKTYAACVRAFGSAVLTIPGQVGKRKAPSTIQDLASGRIVRP